MPRVGVVTGGYISGGYGHNNRPHVAMPDFTPAAALEALAVYFIIKARRPALLALAKGGGDRMQVGPPSQNATPQS
jgi:hypothetical protein